MTRKIAVQMRSGVNPVEPGPDTTGADRGTLIEVQDHYQKWTDDNDIRRTRKHGWDDITDTYWGELPEDWPYLSKVVDPRIRTSIIEKNARLLNSKLRGRLVPREGGDILGAQLNNSLLDYQWDTANFGGTMHSKLSDCDMDTRLYASKFALIYWRYKEDDDGDITFDGNEFKPWDIRDTGLDFAAQNVRNAKWVQLREWVALVDLEENNTQDKEPPFKNLGKLRVAINQERSKSGIRRGVSDRRDNEYVSRVKTLKGLTDRVGEDISFPTIEICTEYREDRWITFAPKHNILLRDIKNPYEHKKIPVAQLKYYPLGDDPLGESEVEPVIPLWKAIQAVVCGYLDEMNIKMRPPLKIIASQARIETIVYGPERQWIVDSMDAVEEMRGNGEAQQWFRNTYTSMVSAFNVAMGDLSTGTSNLEGFETEKTATEIKATAKQQNNRDQKNQASLSDFIKDIMSMWLSNNRQFLFTDPKKKEHLLRIVGSENFEYFKRSGMDEMEVPRESSQAIQDIITESDGQMSDAQINELFDSAKVPKFPIIENPEEKNIDKIRIKPKMKLSDNEDGAEVSLVPQDLEGTYDYIPDVKSMAAGAHEELLQARRLAFQTVTDPNVTQLMQAEGWRLKAKELISSTFEDAGLPDSERFFEKIEEPQVVPGQQPGQPGVPGQPQPGGLPGPTAGPPTPQGPVGI